MANVSTGENFPGTDSQRGAFSGGWCYDWTPALSQRLRVLIEFRRPTNNA